MTCASLRAPAARATAIGAVDGMGGVGTAD
jgi:hypothetical protein